ncbi:translocation/assembly module TamB domain-containing protein [bacterium]|nr:translocation/assembly module TamB domain-containing protein [bacterium]
MLFASVAYVVGQYRRTISNASIIIVDELESRLDREVKISSARVTPFGTVVLDDVAIASGKRLTDGYIVRVKQIRIKYDVKAMLSGMGAQSIKSILVVEPNVNLVRRRDGTLNIQDLLKQPPGRPARPFKGVVSVRGGNLTFRDYLAKTRPLPAMNRIYDMNGSLSAASYPVYKFHGKARGPGGRFQSAEVIGTYDTRAKKINLDVSARGVNAAYLSRYIGLTKSIDVRGGVMNVIAGIRLAKSAGKTKMSLSGVARISDASARLSMMTKPVTGINGIVVLRGQSAIMSVTGRLSGSDVRATGTISGFTKPRLDISVSSNNADFATLVGAFKLPDSARELHASGRGQLKARITGKTSSPIIAVRAKVPGVNIRGYTAKDVEISARYADRAIVVSPLTFTWRDTRFAASGSLSTAGDQRVAISGRATGVNIADLPLPSAVSAKGIANVGFSISGTLVDPTIRANVNVTRGEFRGIPVEQARARITYASGRVEVAALEVTSRAAAGLVTAKGAVTAKRVNLSVTGESVNLATVGQLFGVKDVTGTGYFTGTIRGPLHTPTFSGIFEAFDLGYGKYRADYTRLEFSTDLKTASITSGIVRLFPAEFRFSGSAGGLGTDRIAFKTSGQVDRLTIEKLSEILDRKIDFSGTLVGSFVASGVYLTNPKLGQIPLQDASASAQITLEDGSAFGYPINEASAQLNLIGNRLEVKEAKLSSQEAKANLNGSVMLDTGDVDMTYDISDFDLARLHNVIGQYVVIGGTAHAGGSVTGTTANPKISLDAAIENLIINYSKFDVAQAKAEYSDGLIKTASALIKKGNQSVLIQANRYNLKTNCLTSAGGTIENVSVPEMWNIFRSSPYLRTEGGARLRESLTRLPKLTSGLINGTFSVSGCMTSPEGAIHLAGSDIGVDITRIDTVVLDASLSGGAVNLSQFKAMSGSTSLTATGSYELANRQIQLDASAANFDLSRLSPLLGANTPGGMMAAYFEISGDISSPSVTASVEVKQPSFNGLTFDNLRTSRIEITSDKIESADVILASGNHQVIAHGYLPWDWSTLTIPTNKPMEVTARLNKQNLSMLSSFTTAIEPSATAGSIEASLNISGTPAAPVLNGSLAITDGAIALKNFSNQFNNININMVFDGNRITVDQFSVASSLGGTLSIVPGGYIEMSADGKAETNLQIAASDFSVAEKNALGMQEDISLQFDAGISVTGDVSAPMVTNANVGTVAGGINIHDSHISFVAPNVPESKPIKTPPINPTFNVAVKIGDKVVLAPPNMTLTITGDGLINGSLASPVVVFDPIRIEEGTLRLAVSRLTVEPDGTLYVRYAPPEEPVVRVNLNATTNVTAMDSFGKRQRYEITVAVSGTVSNLDIELSSDPSGLNKEQMLAALGHVSGIFATGESGLQNELGNILTAVGTSTIFAPVETLFVEQLGFEQFSLEYSLGQPLALYVSRKLIGNIYISYYGYLTSDFTSPNDVAYLLGLSYRMNPNYQASVFVDDQQNGSFQIQYTRAFW